jgi:hypothetical protein
MRLVDWIEALIAGEPLDDVLPRPREAETVLLANACRADGGVPCSRR